MLGGRRAPYDPRPALAILERGGGDVAAALDELWDELHHQGDIDEASYAAVPHLVRIHRLNPLPAYHAYAMVAAIEECRLAGHNPDLPADIAQGYRQAMIDLVAIGLTALHSTTDRDTVRSILALVAFTKGCTALGSLALLTESEQHELLER